MGEAGLRIGYLLHETLPSDEANAEQALNTLVELRVYDGLRFDLLVPAPAGSGKRASSRAAEVEAYYALGAGTFGEALRLREMALPRFAPAKMRQVLFDAVVPWLRRGEYDALYVRDVGTLVMALATRVPVVFETYRTDINTAPTLAPFRRWCYTRENLSGVVVHSRMAYESFQGVAMPEDRLLLAYNGHAPRWMLPLLEPEEARVRLGLPRDRPLVCYAGRVASHKGANALVSLAARIPDVTMVVLGTRPGSPDDHVLQGQADRQRARALLSRPRVSPPEVVPYLYAADVLVIPPTRVPLKHGRTVLPLKTFLYLAAGRPIVAPDLPDVREVLEDGRNALLVPPDEPDQAAAAVRRLIEDSQLRARLANAARIDAARYTWAARARLVAEFLRRRLGSQRRQ